MDWQPASLDRRVLGYPCLLAGYSKNSRDPDLILAGKHGAIWQLSKTTFYILVWSPRIASRYLEQHQRIAQGEEIGFVVKTDVALEWVKRLKVSRIRATQLKNISAHSTS